MEKQFHVLHVRVGFPLDQFVLEGEGGVLEGGMVRLPLQPLSAVPKRGGRPSVVLL